jgi:predicted SAM-dependent methyltransferase
MKIEFGCGENPTKKNFMTCDIRSLPGIDFVCDAWKIDTLVAEDSVDEIFSRHFFEHLTYIQGEIVLEKWYKILKSGGTMEMILPNMEYHIDQWTRRSDKKELDHAKAGFWGWQRDSLDNLWDVHKSGYDYPMLEELLIAKGYKNIKNLTKDAHLWIICQK